MIVSMHELIQNLDNLGSLSGYQYSIGILETPCDYSSHGAWWAVLSCCGVLKLGRSEQ